VRRTLTSWFLVVLLVVAGGEAGAQDTKAVRRSSAFRKDPGGAELGMLEPGARVATGRAQGNWIAVTLDGWVYSPSVARTSRGGFDLVVSADGGENLRAAPNGAKVAKLSRGALLDRRTTQGRWIRVRREGWALRSAFAAPAATRARPTQTAGRQDGRTAGGSEPTVVPAQQAGDDAERVVAGTNALLSGEPGGTAVATLADGAEGQVVARSGEWVKLRIEGWVAASDVRSAEGGPRRGVSAAEVRAQPDRWLGQTLEWRLQLVAVRKADALRPELPEGREYLLARGPLPESGFVYVVIPPSQADRFKAMPPLSELTVRGVLRAASTRWLPNPVIDLVEVVGES
jgi:hypothetical protein